jgi:broad specificity phosphatase PhoE
MTDGVNFSAASGDPSVAPPMIMIIRHGEKPHSAGPHGIATDGERDPHSLALGGWIRAGALVGFFAPSWGDPPAGLRRPDAVYGTGYADGHSKRSVQTVTPLAARLGLDVVRRYTHGQERHLAAELCTRAGTTVVAWHHGSIKEIVRHLGEVYPSPPAHWPHDRFDVVWTFTRNRDSWSFAQVPQQLLPGDLPHPIEG